MKNIFYLLLFITSISFGQNTQYFNYKASDSTYVGTNYYAVKPSNSTAIPPTVDTQFAKFTGTTWIDSRTPEQILKSQVPASVTKMQLKLQLTRDGFNMSLIDYVISQLAEPDRSYAQIAWVDCTQFDRGNALLQALAYQLGLSETDLDMIFINASKL